MSCCNTDSCTFIGSDNMLLLKSMIRYIRTNIF